MEISLSVTELAIEVTMRNALVYAKDDDEINQKYISKAFARYCCQKKIL